MGVGRSPHHCSHWFLNLDCTGILSILYLFLGIISSAQSPVHRSLPVMSSLIPIGRKSSLSEISWHYHSLIIYCILLLRWYHSVCIFLWLVFPHYFFWHSSTSCVIVVYLLHSYRIFCSYNLPHFIDFLGGDMHLSCFNLAALYICYCSVF